MGKKEEEIRESKKKWRENNKVKVSEYNKKWYQKNKEKIKEKNKEYNKKWYQKNKEKKKEKTKNYQKNNKEKVKEKQAEWYQKNKEEKKEWRQNNHMKVTIYKWKWRGLIVDDYESLYHLVQSTEKCEGCECILTENKPRTNTSRVLDHCHITGQFRAVLCHACNIRQPRQTPIKL
jgi:phosphoglycolate phosphatase-like HAD superfamily hydrolase